MSIARMSLIEIVAPRAKTMPLLTAIQDFGSLQLEELPLVVPGTRSYLHREQLSEEQLDERKKLSEALQALDEMRASLKDVGAADPKAVQTARDGLKGTGADYLLLTVSRLKRKLSSLIRKRTNIASDIKSLGNYQRRLDELSTLLSDTDTSGNIAYWALMVGPGDRVAFDILVDELKRATHGTQRVLQAPAGGKEKSGADVILVTVPVEYATEAKRLVQTADLSELRLPMEVRDLPLREAVAHLQQEGRELPGKLGKVEGDLARFRDENLALIAAVEQVCADTLTRLESLDLLAHSEMLVAGQAWLPSGDVGDLREHLMAAVDPACLVTELRDMAGQSQNVPVHLENPKAVRPFEKLLSLFSTPLYGSFDPTILMAIVFPLFFGLILGDIGYGLILLGLTLWGRRRWKHIPLAQDVTSIAIACCGASILFGIIFGEFLGDLGHRLGWIPLSIGGLRVLPIWEERSLIINELLTLTIVIGFLHMSLALVLGITESIRMKNRHHLLESLGLAAGLLGVVLLLAPLSPETVPVAVRKALGFTSLGGGIITLGINGGVAGPIELISLVANILSYCRLMALGVAGMVLANLANSIAAGQANIFVGILLSLPMHALAVALAILEPTIHALRLHYVEFLPKFFVGDGREYTPLRRKESRDDT